MTHFLIRTKNILPRLVSNEKVLWISFMAIALVVIWVSRPSAPAPSETVDVENAETFIPRGHLLIPIELKNTERLDGIIGPHGIVDLYQAATEIDPKARLVGRRFRLIRAPLNPQSFAVLVRDHEADHLASFPGPFVASIRPLDAPGHEVSSPIRRPVIEYQQENPK